MITNSEQSGFKFDINSLQQGTATQFNIKSYNYK